MYYSRISIYRQHFGVEHFAVVVLNRNGVFSCPNLNKQVGFLCYIKPFLMVGSSAATAETLAKSMLQYFKH